MNNNIVQLLLDYNVSKYSFQQLNGNYHFINQHVDHIYIINLESNRIRRNYIHLIMKKMQINYELIVVQPPTEIQLQTIKEINGSLTNGEIGCYLSHMFCYHNAMQNNYKNIIVFEDDIIFHQDFHRLFESIIHQKQYDFLMLGASDYHFRKYNYRNVNPVLSTYQPQKINSGILGCHAIYFSKEGYTQMFQERLQYPTFMDHNLIQFLDYFSHSFSICSPNLIVPELSTTNLSHHIWITNHKKENYYFKKCFSTTFSFQHYYYLYLDIFQCITKENIDIELTFEQNIMTIIALYFSNNSYHLDNIKRRLRYDFFTVSDLFELIQ